MKSFLKIFVRKAEVAVLAVCLATGAVLYMTGVTVMAEANLYECGANPCSTGTSIGITSSPQPAPQPTGLNAALGACGTGSVTLSWDNNTAAITYRLYRDNSTTKIFDSRVYSFTDTGLQPGSQHTYYLELVTNDGSGHTSLNVIAPAQCSTANTTIGIEPVTQPTSTPTPYPAPTSTSTPTSSTSPYTTTPTQPTTNTSMGLSISISPQCGTRDASLNWSGATNATYYQVFRNDTLLSSTPGFSFTDTGLASATTYNYKIVARNSAQYIAYTVNSVTTPPPCSTTEQPNPVPPLTTNPITQPPTQPVSQPIESVQEPVGITAPIRTDQTRTVTPTTNTLPSRTPTDPLNEPAPAPYPVPTTKAVQPPSVAPAVIVSSMQNVAQIVGDTRDAINNAQDELARTIDEHIETTLQFVDPASRDTVRENAVRIRESLLNQLTATLPEISPTGGTDFSTLKTAIADGLKQIDALAPGSTGRPEPTQNVIAGSLENLSTIIQGASTALQANGGFDVYRDSNRDGISDYDSEHIYNIDPKAPSVTTTVGTTTLTAGQKILLGYDPSQKELVKIVPEEPAISPAPETSVYKVEEVKLNENKAVVIRGTALPNSYVTLYVYSTPVVVTVKTNSRGEWEYTVDRELESGAHTVYAATVDNSGKIVAKSSPIPFTKTAEAATLDVTPPIGTVGAQRPSFLNNAFMIPLIALSLIFVFGVLFVMGKKQDPTPGI